MEKGYYKSVAQPSFWSILVICQEQSDVAILWIINMFCDCFARNDYAVVFKALK